MSFFLLSQPLAFAWWDHGHQVVAELGNSILTPKTAEKIKVLLEYPVAAPGSVELSQHTNYMASAAVWADQIKQSFFRANAGSDPYGETCHYLNILVYSDEVISLKDNQTEIHDRALKSALLGKNAVNCSWAFIKVLREFRNRYLPSVPSSKDLTDQAVALRYLIHVVGDIHQPLHDFTVANRATPQHQNAGASLMKIHRESIPVFSADPAVKESDTLVFSLHALWDGGLGVFAQLPYRTMSADTVAKLGTPTEHAYVSSSANSLVDLNVMHRVLLEKNLSLENWVTEGVMVGLQYAYSGNSNLLDLTAVDFPFYTKISDFPRYVAEGAASVKDELSLGGYRLGYLLNAIFDPANAPETFVKLVDEIK